MLLIESNSYSFLFDIYANAHNFERRGITPFNSVFYCLRDGMTYFFLSGHYYSNGDYPHNGSIDEEICKSGIYSESVDSGKPPSGLYLHDMDTISERPSEAGMSLIRI